MGYLFTGMITAAYSYREEVLEAGDGFYMSPAMSPQPRQAASFLQFSPAKELAEVRAVMMVNAQQMQGA